MRLKYQSLIAFGISTIIFSGCTSSGGGFLNLGVADALRKSKVCLLKKKLTYSKTPVGNTGISLPTFGAQPTGSSGAVPIDSYSVQQTAPATPQVAPAPTTGSCGCGSPENTAVSTGQFYMPQQQYVVEPMVSNPIVQQPPAEVVASPIETVPSSAPKINELPTINQLPSGSETPSIEPKETDHFEKFDTEGTLEPLGQNEEADDFELDTQEEIADGQRDDTQSIFEEAELTKRSQIRFDSTTGLSRTERVAEPQKPKMLTLHARPAQSHNVFNQSNQTSKMVETVQASHKPYYRQLNALRQQPAKLNDRGYRQARNTTGAIEFKPLPPVSETPAAEVLAPKTKLAPLQESTIKRGTPSDDVQNGSTRTANAKQHETAQVTPRIPILRATTVSSASILSLKNLANVIDDKQTQTQERFFEANRHTAQGTASSSVDVLSSGEATVGR